MFEDPPDIMPGNRAEIFGHRLLDDEPIYGHSPSRFFEALHT
jgi:hypothetical protein